LILFIYSFRKNVLLIQTTNQSSYSNQFTFGSEY